MTASADATMAWYAASQIQDCETVFVGIGTPGLSAMIAKRSHARGITLIFESGIIGANPTELPLSTGSPSAARGAAMHGSMLQAFATLQQGRVDVGLLSGAEVDRRGNLNTTVIGPYLRPAVRLPGAGGAHDIAVLARRVVILMPHEPRRFVERVSFVTSPGHPETTVRCPTAGEGAGPVALVTSRALFGFDNGELTLAAISTEGDADEAVEGIPWSVPRRKVIERLPPIPADARERFPFLFGEQAQ